LNEGQKRMTSQQQARVARVDMWLANGGVVVASSERAARSVASAFHSARRAEGLLAWPTPEIFSWEGWLRESWRGRNSGGLLLLNPLQEQMLWSRVIGKSQTGARLLHPGRLASAAQQAYRLLANYAPGALKSSARLGWLGDPAVFHDWLNDFESSCRRESLVSASLLALQLTEALRTESQNGGSPRPDRPGLLLVGFDRLLETQEDLLNAWGEWQLDGPGDDAGASHFFTATDGVAETAACVSWLREKFRGNPEARLLVIAPGLQNRRGELERAVLEASSTDETSLDFEFSLGVPLIHVGVARSALLLMRWLHEPLVEHDVDWLLSSGCCAASDAEEIALAEAMYAIRSRGLERPEWTLDDFAKPLRPELTPPAAFVERMFAARDGLMRGPSRQSPFDWTELTRSLLEIAGWPGFRPESSVAFQARQRWEAVLDDCGSLGFDGSLMEWGEFVAATETALGNTIFATESTDSRIQITEPMESAGQLADGIWFLGADEENWPGRGTPNALLPISLQRETGMPHASQQMDWALAQDVTGRLLASADEVVFSFSRQSMAAEMRPSRLITQRLGHPEHLSPDLTNAGESRRQLTEVFEDTSLIRFPHAVLRGGAGSLTSQSLCPFQAFGTARLATFQWEAAEPGLNAKQRGQLLHAVLHGIWGGSGNGGISSRDELLSKDLRAFVSEIVDRVMRESFGSGRRNSLPSRFPARFLELEAERLTRLVSEWLAYERERLPFVVTGTEVDSEVEVAGLRLRVRLDRVDELANGGKLIIDYKSSGVGPAAWDGERPDDVQLPLYAAFAGGDHLEGLIFARVRPGAAEFRGRVRHATETLRIDLRPQNALVAKPLTDEQLAEWRRHIERLGEEFLAGRAEVDPKDGPNTCGSCHLHAVCRIYEQPVATILAGEDEGADDAKDEGGGDA
jgi:ATP-dependent helicase/nuclease subunit B